MRYDKKMKIGILTLPITENYGGILQAVALYRILHTPGHEVILLYKNPYQSPWKRIAIGILARIPFQNYRNIKSNHQAKQVREKRKKFHKPFIENEIFAISPELYTKKNLRAYAQKEAFDAVVVGSDQVWRKQYVNDPYYKSYFLDFLDGSKTKKIAYAASFGEDHWGGKGDIGEIAVLMKDFTAVSTREASGVGVCWDAFGYDEAKHVLDPTLLLDKNFYIDVVISKYDVSSIPKDGLVTYVLDEAVEKRELIEDVQASLGISNVHHLKGFNRSGKSCTVPQWLASIAYADFVVTDSFHGMVFSILFEKNFVVVANHRRGLDRFTSLLSLFGLEDRLVSCAAEIKGKSLDALDYVAIGQILDEHRNRSLVFLASALSGEV